APEISNIKHAKNEFIIFQQCHRKTKNCRYRRRVFFCYTFVYRYASKIYCRGSKAGLICWMGSWSTFYAIHSRVNHSENNAGVETLENDAFLFSFLSPVWNFYNGQELAKGRTT